MASVFDPTWSELPTATRCQAKGFGFHIGQIPWQISMSFPRVLAQVCSDDKFTLPSENSVWSHYGTHRATLTAGPSPHTCSGPDGRQAWQSPLIGTDPSRRHVSTVLFSFATRKGFGKIKVLHLQQRPLTVSPLTPDHHKGVLTIFQKACSIPHIVFCVHGTTFGDTPSAAPETGRLALFSLCTMH